MFVAIAKVSGDIMMCRWGRCKGSNDRKKKASLDYLPWFLAVFFIRFWVYGQYKLRTVRPVMFASLRSNVISALRSKDFWLGRGNGFGCRGKCRDRATIVPHRKYKWCSRDRNLRDRDLAQISRRDRDFVIKAETETETRDLTFLWW